MTPARLTKTGDYTLFLAPQSVSQNVNGAREHHPESETDISARGRTNLAVERNKHLKVKNIFDSSKVLLIFKIYDIFYSYYVFYLY
jgi:hypothetical protein